MSPIHVVYNVYINDSHMFHVFWRNKVNVIMAVLHNVRTKIIIYKTDILKVNVTAFTRAKIQILVKNCDDCKGQNVNCQGH